MSFLTAGTKASNSRLWKQAQQLINQDRHKEFKVLCETNPQLAPVLLDSRISTRTRFDDCLTDRFGLSATTDLNALEITLLQHRHDLFAYPILVSLKRHATPAQLKSFLSHVFSNGNTCLYLAVFRSHLRLVKLMLDLGADPCSKNDFQQSPIDYCTLPDISRLLEPVKTSSILLKKAMVMMPPTTPPSHLVPSDHFPKPSASPLSFSSSSSSSSSSFSIDLWTPSPVIKEVDEDVFSLQQGIEALDIFPQRILPPRNMPRKKIIRKNSVCEEQVTKDLPKKVLPPSSSRKMLPPSSPKVLPPPSKVLPPRKVLPKDIQRQKKQVQFDPRIILIDSCVRGDQQELKEWMMDDMSEICDSQNRSLLHIALMHGNEHLVEDLLDKVDINQTDLDGWTCLHYTAAMGLWKSLAKLASLPHINLHVKTRHGLKVEDCPNSSFGKRKCVIDKALCT